MPLHDTITPAPAHPLPFAPPGDALPLRMSSLEIAERTGKDHRHVLADIRKMLADLDIRCAEFSAQYTDKTGRSLPCFALPQRECLILASGYDVKLRARIIDRWTELERGQKSFNPADPNHVLALISHYAEESKRAQEQIAARDRALEEAGPAIRFSADVAAAANGVKLETAARSFRPGRNTFYNLLRRDGILLQGKPIRPSSEHKHHFRVETRVSVEQDGQSRIRESYRLTGAGFQWLRTRYADLLLPNDDDPNLIEAEGAETGEAE